MEHLLESRGCNRWQSVANARYLKEHYIDHGKLGRASGEGFYQYDMAAARS
jgi:3-hydroxybutyryl-CoA dehydrogenase